MYLRLIYLPHNAFADFAGDIVVAGFFPVMEINPCRNSTPMLSGKN